MDYIKREDAIDCVLSQYCASSDETEEALGNAVDAIKALPAADVEERKVGRWRQCSYSVMVCSECERYWIRDVDRYDFNYCPRCGAKMEE